MDLVVRLSPEDLARLGGPIVTDLLAVDPDIFIQDAAALGRRIRQDLLTNGPVYTRVLRGPYETRTLLACLCRLSVAHLLIHNAVTNRYPLDGPSTAPGHPLA